MDWAVRQMPHVPPSIHFPTLVFHLTWTRRKKTEWKGEMWQRRKRARSSRSPFFCSIPLFLLSPCFPILSPAVFSFHPFLPVTFPSPSFSSWCINTNIHKKCSICFKYLKQVWKGNNCHTTSGSRSSQAEPNTRVELSKSLSWCLQTRSVVAK